MWHARLGRGSLAQEKAVKLAYEAVCMAGGRFFETPLTSRSRRPSAHFVRFRQNRLSGGNSLAMRNSLVFWPFPSKFLGRQGRARLRARARSVAISPRLGD